MSDSREVAAVIDNMNRRGIEPLPESLRRAAVAYYVYVFNVGPESHLRAVGTGTYLVPGKEKGERYSKPVKIPATVYTTIPTENGQMRQSPSDGMDVAKDIVQIGKMADFTKFGLFISESAVPSEEAIEAAEQARVDMLSQRVQDADEYYQVNGGMVTVSVGGNSVTRSNIQDAHRAALRELGWTRPWATKNIQMSECWNCGRSVLPTSAKCFHEGCGAPLKNEEAKARFMAGDEEEPVRRGRGRPKAS
jgi:hypothetical protein